MNREFEPEYHFNFTSNHNEQKVFIQILVLNIISILHQTTTKLAVQQTIRHLNIISILHQTTTSNCIN